MNLTIHQTKASEFLKDRCVERNVVSLGRILEMDKIQLINTLGINLQEAEALIMCVSEKVTPLFKMKNIRILDEKLSQKSRYIRTGMTMLDNVLCGGIPVGSITEIAGESTIGKTTFCQTLTVEVAKTSNVLYLDTEDNRTSIDRMSEILTSQSRNASNSEINMIGSRERSSLDDDSVKEILKAVRMVFLPNLKTMMTYLENIEDHVYDFNIGLIILDSVAFPIRKEIDNYIERSKILGEIACSLKNVAENCQIPVIVTNHITHGKVAGYSNNSFYDQSSSMKAALGNTWSHCVNTRLVMSTHTDFSMILKEGTNNRDVRTITVEKSPIAGKSSVIYQITNCGVVVENDLEKDSKKRKIGEEEKSPPKVVKKRTLREFSMSEANDDNDNLFL